MSDSREREHISTERLGGFCPFQNDSKDLAISVAYLIEKTPILLAVPKSLANSEMVSLQISDFEKDLFFLFLTPELGKYPLSTSLSDDCESEHGSKDKGGDEKVICLQNASIRSELNHIKVC